MEAESRPSSSHTDQTPGLQSSPASDRRKSGRVSKKPELFSQEYKDAGSKRKRADGDDDDDVEDVSASESDDATDEPDEEELREKRRAARKSSAKNQSSARGKPKSRPAHSAKKQRVGNGVRGQLALRPAANGKRTVSRPKKTKARPSLVAGETGLFGTCLLSSLVLIFG